MEISRYPVKTMAGEKLERVRIGPLGLDVTESSMSRTNRGR